MTSLDADAALLARPLPARVAVSLGHAWRTLVGAIRSTRNEGRASHRDRQEREALAGLGEHMLKDVGASSWLVANAASRARDAFQRRIDTGPHGV